MHPIRKKRLVLVSWILLGIGVAVALALMAMRQNINLFYTPTQVANGEVPMNRSLRLGGMVVKGSVHHDQQQLQVQFDVTDNQQTVRVFYHGVLPDLFKEGKGVVTEGKFDAQHHFIAQTVLAKHDENYMPPNVAKSMKHVT